MAKLDREVVFPSARSADEHGVVAVGEDYRLGTLLAAYRGGIFPWPHALEEGHLVLWCSPDPRCIFPLDAVPHWSRSLTRTLRTTAFRVSLNLAFGQVMQLCGATRATGTWITPALQLGYARLHAAGHAHSVEVWQGAELVGGIYGVATGGLFAGESMFHTRSDASKVAFAVLVQCLRACGYALFDVQVATSHLMSLGCVEVTRNTYLRRLSDALTVAPLPLHALELARAPQLAGIALPHRLR
jgi:leucyl/phenylalanyl-tRNA---protein transferase